MWWLLDALLLFRNAEELRTSPTARREAVQGCLVVLAIGAFAAFLAFVIIAANSRS